MADFEQLTTFDHRGFAVSLAFKQVKVYLRSGLVLLVVVTAGIVLWKNRGYHTPVWFFGLTDEKKSISVVWLIVCTATATRTAQWVLSFCWGLWRDMREVKRARATEQERKSQEKRSAELDERERRLEEMLERGAESVEADEKE